MMTKRCRLLPLPILGGYLLLLLLGLTALGGCQEHGESSTESDPYDYPIQPVDIRHVHLTDSFWLPVVRRVQDKTIDYAIQKCIQEGRLDNFLIAGGKMDGSTKGAMPFDDTDIYKIIEGASNSLISAPNPRLETLLDSLISIIAVGQEADGYLTTWRTINPARPPAEWVPVTEGKRWESLGSSHELYNAGHLYEAAAVHYRATGKRNFLDIALRNANLMVQTFGPGKLEQVPGHQIIETGLIQLFRITQQKDYLELARYFLDARGDSTMHDPLHGPYSQDHKPVIQQEEVVGHAVRAMYMYAGMTDIAAIYHDSAYASAVNKLWENMVSKKMYITGGIGALHQGEAFGANYELPNKTAYNETCASIGDVYWNHRLFMLYGAKKYYDVIERTLYNGLLSGLSLDGKQFFYPNALESDGVYPFNQGACTRKSWFDCSCCPTNLIRFIPAIPGLIYAKHDHDLYVNLYVGNEAEVDMNGRLIRISQRTNYPWNGQVELTVSSNTAVPMNLKLRLPGWASGEVLPSDLYTYISPAPEPPAVHIDGEKVPWELEGGYIILPRTWEGSHTVTLDFPMQVQVVRAREQIAEDRGKLALEYGPIVYALEEADNPAIDAVTIAPDENYQVAFQPGFLNGVEEIFGAGPIGSFKAIPYYAWSNRGAGKMKVWIPATP
ncbi:MAG: glycoside hydrolase family 127 protein [Saprospiraceae bacterium]